MTDMRGTEGPGASLPQPPPAYDPPPADPPAPQHAALPPAGARPHDPHRHRRRHHRQDRRRRTAAIVGGVLLVVLALVIGAGFLAAVTYLPLVGEAQEAKASLETLAANVNAVGPDVTHEQIDGLRAQVADATARTQKLADTAQNDPLVNAARIIPSLRDQVDGARAVLEAGLITLGAADRGLDLGDKYVAVRDSPLPGVSRLAQAVELLATSQEDLDAIDAALTKAQATIDAAPEDLWGPIASARDLVRDKLGSVLPVFDRLRNAAGILPGILGWERPRTYLVLDQSPPELRPTGGFIGSYGLVTVDKGQVAGMEFHGIESLGSWKDYPCMEPPAQLTSYLLGDQCWETADGNWSPDFPTSAADTLRLYANQDGALPVDGVVGITPFAIDELLALTGPVTVPGTDVTIAAGETEWKVLEATRAPSEPGQDRKAILGVLAGEILRKVLDLPAKDWPELADALGRIAADRDAAVWFADPADPAADPTGLKAAQDARALAAEWRFDGAVRQDAGDYLFVNDANVSPVSKLNIVTSRTMSDAVDIDAVGNATHALEIAWSNGVDDPANAAYKALTNRGGANLGDYTRVLVPQQSRIGSVSGGSYVRLTAPEAIGETAGRTWFGTYLQVPPGESTVAETWVSPYAATLDGRVGTYVLTVQKQMGRPADAFSLTITVPDGATIAEATGGLEVDGGTATWSGTLERDLVVAIRYVMGE